MIINSSSRAKRDRWRDRLIVHHLVEVEIMDEKAISRSTRHPEGTPEGSAQPDSSLILKWADSSLRSE